ncbi:hypothetical protein HL42_6116 [Trichophyton rubrum]|nr:hypothetical protein HL42_6116 [Trichophyton rubrum]
MNTLSKPLVIRGTATTSRPVVVLLLLGIESLSRPFHRESRESRPGETAVHWIERAKQDQKKQREIQDP